MTKFLPSGTWLDFRHVHRDQLAIICHPPGALARTRVELLYDFPRARELTHEIFECVRAKLTAGTSIEMRFDLDTGIRIFAGLSSRILAVGSEVAQ
jgi:hypothetical protein